MHIIIKLIIMITIMRTTITNLNDNDNNNNNDNRGPTVRRRPAGPATNSLIA